MNKLLFLIICITFSFQTYEKKYTTIEVDNLYSVEIPKFLEQTDSLHSQAQFQYKNSRKHFYIFILHIPLKKDKNIDLKSAHKFGLKEIKDEVYHFHNLGKTEEIKLENTEGLQSSFYFGKKHDELSVIGVYSQFATIKSKTHLYKIHIWTWVKNTKKNKQMMQRIIESFKELE